MRPTVFVLAAEAGRVAILTAHLERSRRFKTEAFIRTPELFRQVDADPPDLLVCDADVPGGGTVAFIQEFRHRYPTLPLIAITPTTGGKGEYGPEDALRAGATDFAPASFDPLAFIARVARCVEEAPARELLSSVTRSAFDPHGIIGSHPLIQAVRGFVQQVASVPRTAVLLFGEPGTGKSLVARAIHGAGAASKRRFVEINCAALPQHQLEAELFGYETGALGNSAHAKRGLVEVADQGTLFLDEIEGASPDTQAKLLDLLESGTFRRVGSAEDSSVSLRIIAATRSDPSLGTVEGRVRQDLLSRLNVASQVMPPLRQVRSDIPAMTVHFVERAANYFGKPLPGVEEESLARLQRYDWPGNARELRNVIERAMIFARGAILQIPELTGAAPRAVQRDVIGIPLGLSLADVERQYIEAMVQANGGNINRTAEQLGVTRKVLWQKRKRLGLIST